MDGKCGQKKHSKIYISRFAVFEVRAYHVRTESDLHFCRLLSTLSIPFRTCTVTAPSSLYESDSSCLWWALMDPHSGHNIAMNYCARSIPQSGMSSVLFNVLSYFLVDPLFRWVLDLVSNAGSTCGRRSGMYMRFTTHGSTCGKKMGA